VNWTIISVGDGNFLVQILNGLAMLYNAGTLASLGRLGLLVGVMVLGLGAIANPSRFTPNYVLLGLIGFMAFFGRTTTVTVVDEYTGQTQQVANVPLGTAVAGGGISWVGYQLTQKFEQVFSTPGMTTQGFGTPLATLAAVRQSYYSQGSLLGADRVGGPNTSFWNSWFNYISDCTMPNMKLNNYDLSWLLSQPNLEEGLQFATTQWTTTIMISPSGPAVESCAQAYTDLDQFSRQTFLPAYYTIVMGSNIAQQVGVPAQSQVQDALDALGSSTSADDFVLTSILAGVWQQVTQYDVQQSQNWATQVGMQTALMQNNAAWTSQGMFFSKYMRPFMAMTEGFAYATAPFIAFMIGLGPIGVGIFTQFFKSIIWIQSWQLMFSVVNLYCSLSANGQMSALQNTGGAGLSSLGGVLNSDSILQNWLAVAGSLAASVPPLTAALVFGGTALMSSMIGRMQTAGSDRVDPSTLSEPTIHQAPKLEWYGHNGGQVGGGAAGDRVVQGNSGMAVNMGAMVSSSVSATQQSMLQRSASFTSALQQGLQRIEGEERSAGTGVGASSVQAGSFNSSQGVTGSQGTFTDSATTGSLQHSESAKSGTTDNARVAWQPSLGGIVGGAASGAAAGGAKGGIVSRLTSLFPSLQVAGGAAGSAESGDSASKSRAGSEGSRAGTENSTSFQRTLDNAQILKDAKISDLTKIGFSESEARNITRSAAEVVSSSDTYQRQRQMSANMSGAQEVRPDNMRAMFQEGGERVQRAVMGNPDLSGAVSQKATQLINSGIFNSNDRAGAEYFASLLTASNQNPFARSVSGGSLDNLRSAITGGLLGDTSQALGRADTRLGAAVAGSVPSDTAQSVNGGLASASQALAEASGVHGAFGRGSARAHGAIDELQQHGLAASSGPAAAVGDGAQRGLSERNDNVYAQGRSEMSILQAKAAPLGGAVKEIAGTAKDEVKKLYDTDPLSGGRSETPKRQDEVAPGTGNP
jgi:conjugal transfer mating pair stabilization protein TraG